MEWTIRAIGPRFMHDEIVTPALARARDIICGTHEQYATFHIQDVLFEVRVERA